MVHTYTFEFYIFAIQTETGVCIKIDVTETVGCLVSVFYFAVYQNFSLYIGSWMRRTLISADILHWS